MPREMHVPLPVAWVSLSHSTQEIQFCVVDGLRAMAVNYRCACSCHCLMKVNGNVTENLKRAPYLSP